MVNGEGKKHIYSSWCPSIFDTSQTTVNLPLYIATANNPHKGSHRGFTALASKAIAAGHQVVSIWRDITVGLDVLLGRKGVGYLPCSTVPHPVNMYQIGMVETHTVYEQSQLYQWYVQHPKCFNNQNMKFKMLISLVLEVAKLSSTPDFR